MSVCRSCGKPVEWIRTERGKNMPVDPPYVAWDEAEPKDVLVTNTGKTFMKHAKDEPAPWKDFKGRVSHFATCPQSDNWRRKNE